MSQDQPPTTKIMGPLIKGGTHLTEAMGFWVDFLLHEKTHDQFLKNKKNDLVLITDGDLLPLEKEELRLKCLELKASQVSLGEGVDENLNETLSKIKEKIKGPETEKKFLRLHDTKNKMGPQ